MKVNRVIEQYRISLVAVGAAACAAAGLFSAAVFARQAPSAISGRHREVLHHLP